MKLLCCDDLKLAKSIHIPKFKSGAWRSKACFRSALKSDRAAVPGPSMKSTCGSQLIATARQSSILWIAQQSKLYRFRDIPTAPSPTLEVATDALGGEPVAATLQRRRHHSVPRGEMNAPPAAMNLENKASAETLRMLGRKPRLVPNHTVIDGISAARKTIESSHFDVARCQRGIECLRS